MDHQAKRIVEVLLLMERGSSDSVVAARLDETVKGLTDAQLGAVLARLDNGPSDMDLMGLTKRVANECLSRGLIPVARHRTDNANDFAQKYGLSKRERDILNLTARGLSYKEIAHMVGLTTGTVRILLARVFRKVGATTRAELIYLATQASNQEERPPRPLSEADASSAGEGGEVLELLFDPEDVDAETAARVIDALSCIYGGELEIESIKPAPPGKIDSGRTGPSREMDAAIGS